MSDLSTQQRETLRLSEESSLLEEMPHTSNAFPVLLRDHLVEERTLAQCGLLDLETDLLPPEFVEAHYLPRRFQLSEFAADLTEVGTTQDSAASWLLDVTCAINGVSYRLNSNTEKTTLATSGGTGEDLRYVFSPEMSTRFLASIALGAYKINPSFVPEQLANPYADRPTRIKHFLHMIGNSGGQYNSRTTSFLPIPSQDRGVLVDINELETTTSSSVDVTYHLAMTIGEGVLTDETSHQHEAVQEGSPSICRYAERKPGVIEPADLPYGNFSDGQPSRFLTFTPTENGQEYDRVNATVMTVLRHYLDQPKYRQLDRTIGLDVFRDVSDIEDER